VDITILKFSSFSNNLKDGTLPAKYQPIRYSVTYPATDRHVERSRSSPKEIWFETKEMFLKVHQPYIDIQKGHLSWVYNILDKNREKCNEIDRIIFDDEDKETGFLILPDLKWDQKDPRELDLLVLVHRRDLNTVRDLNQSHMPLLQNILHKSTKVISEKYKISVSLKIGAYGEYSQVTFKEQTFL
jgi:m7GpppX diphosphatase